MEGSRRARKGETKRRGGERPAKEGAADPPRQGGDGEVTEEGEGRTRRFHALVIRAWDRPEERDPPSQRPEDTHEEARKRKVG